MANPPSKPDPALPGRSQAAANATPAVRPSGGKPIPTGPTQPVIRGGATQANEPVGASAANLDATLTPPAHSAEGLVAVRVEGTMSPADPTLVNTSEDSGDQSTPALAEDAKAGNLSTLKDYRLIAKLGEGGMGAVYKAHQLSLDRVVAVKVPFKHLAKDDSFVSRFYREARIMAKLDHPNILRCYGVGEENGWHYLAMEFIDGDSMQSWLKKLGKLSVADAVHVTLACAHALQHAHEQDLIHRDIKPDNILVTNKGQVKVADMGLAKALSDDLGLSRTGMGAGTPHYMAPEQARDAKHVDCRSDIYALGCMLYCFLTGRPPFSADTYVDLILSKEKGKYPPARRFNPDVPERLDLIIDKAIAPKPDSRYKSCAELIQDLEKLQLASNVLTFVPGATATNLPRAAGPAMTSRNPPRDGAVATKTPTSPAAGPAAPAADVWYLALKSQAGKVVKRKLTRAQVVAMIKNKSFDLNGLLSRNLKGPYRNIAHFKEFEHVLQGRLVQEKAERRTAQFHSAYEKILKEEKTYKLKRWFRDLFRNVTGWITLLLLLAVLAGGGYMVWFFLGPTLRNAYDAIWGIVNRQ